MSMLSTRRLTMRPPQIVDFPVCRDVLGPNAAMATGGSRSDKESRRQLSEMDGCRALSDFDWFTVADGDGRAGVAGADSVHAETELGPIAYPPSRRLGATTDDTRAMHGRECGAFGAQRRGMSVSRLPVPSCRLDIGVAAKLLLSVGRPLVQEAQS